MEPVVRDLAQIHPGSPAGLEPAGSGVAQDHVVVRYRLPGQGEPLVFTLWHPSVAEPGDITTDRFAVRAPVAPDHPLTRAFVKACRSVEPRFRWTATGASPGQGLPTPFEAAPTRLLMCDVLGVMESVAQATERDGKDPSVLRRALVFLVSARRLVGEGESPREALDTQIEEVTAAFGRVFKAAERAGSPGLMVEGWCVDLAVGGSIPGAEELLSAKSSPCSLSHVATTLQLLGRDEEALVIVDRILERDATCGPAHHLGAEIIGKRKDWAGLLKRVDAAREARPGDRGLDARRATALRGLGKYEEARALQEAAARLDPHDAGTMSSLANLTTMTRSDEQSYQELVGACERDPEDIVSCFLAGVVAHYLAHHKDCVDRMVSLMGKLPGQPRVPMYAAISSFYLGRQDDAERYIADAAKIATAMDPDVYYCRAIIRRGKDMDGAIKDLERFLAVARYGWHSEGKVGRVTEELEMLRRGEIPPPAEAHHRAEGAPIPEGARPGGAGRSAPEPNPEPSPAAEPSAERDEPANDGEEGPWLWIVAGVVLALGLGLWFRRPGA
ncbi:MAG: hypothetical protein VYE15_01705 [Myxococcota bacterium]|nr:hypothetical protein [Myxococcota bacterium]